MNIAARATLGIGVLAGLCFAGLAVMSKLWIEPPGQAIFDARLFGYDVAAVDAFLLALSPEGREIYLGPFRVLDTVFPALAALALGAVIWRQSAGLHTVARLGMLVLPASYLMMDYAENALLADIIWRGVGAVEQTVLRASQFTTAKWALLGLSGLAALGSWRIAPKTRKAKQ